MKSKFCSILLTSVILTCLTHCKQDVLLPEIIYGNSLSLPKDTVPLNPNLNLIYDSIRDIEGNVYKTIEIGSQVWMAENLKTTRYNDSTAIYQGYGAPAGYTDWFFLKVGAYVWWENGGPSSWGAHYNWHAVNTKKLCPYGWHVPTNPEWNTLLSSTGGGSAIMKSGTNASGFSAIVTGDLCGWGFCAGSCIFWTADPSDPYGDGESFYAHCVSLGSSGVAIIGCSEPQSDGYNVRCMKDNK